MTAELRVVRDSRRPWSVNQFVTLHYRCSCGGPLLQCLVLVSVSGVVFVLNKVVIRPAKLRWLALHLSPRSQAAAGCFGALMRSFTVSRYTVPCCYAISIMSCIAGGFLHSRWPLIHWAVVLVLRFLIR